MLLLLRILGFGIGKSIWVIAFIWISISSHLAPTLTKAAQQPAAYEETQTAFVSAGAPVWKQAAKWLAPILSQAVGAIAKLPRPYVENLTINSTPNDAGEYIRIFTLAVLILVFLNIVPAMWRVVTAPIWRRIERRLDP